MKIFKTFQRISPWGWQSFANTNKHNNLMFDCHPLTACQYFIAVRIVVLLIVFCFDLLQGLFQFDIDLG